MKLSALYIRHIIIYGESAQYIYINININMYLIMLEYLLDLPIVY